MKLTQIKNIILVILLSISSNSWAYVPVATDSRIKTLLYSPQEVFNLKFHHNYQSYIEFPEGEEIEIITLGDRYSWNIKKVGQRLFIKPYQKDVSTNMTIITSKRPYHFEIFSSNLDFDIADPDLVLVAKFYYPESTYDFMQNVKVRKPIKSLDESRPANKDIKQEETKEEAKIVIPAIIPPIAAASSPAVTPQSPAEIAIPAEPAIAPQMTNNIPDPAFVEAPISPVIPPAPVQPQVTNIIPPMTETIQVTEETETVPITETNDLSKNFNYSLVGPNNASIIPVKVYDDSINTYFTFASNTLPDIFYVNPDGSEIPADYSILDGEVIVKNTAWQFSLRNNNELICIFNENKINF